MNVALYGVRDKLWAMTERRRTSIVRSHDMLGIGDSRLSWDGQSLTIDIVELAVPHLKRLSGRIRLYPGPQTACNFRLDINGAHWWRPIAPRARVDIQLNSPALRWCGSGYFDMNHGSEPLENAFSTWTWSRTEIGSGAAVLYDVARRGADPLSLALRFDESGHCEPFAPPTAAALLSTGWRLQRHTRSESGKAAVLRTLEDAPFYARSEVAVELFGAKRRCMHESLSLDRFSRRWVQAMLPFRMPRAFR